MSRHEKQRQVERLLARIRIRVGEIERMRARGVRGRLLREAELELDRDRSRLASIVAQPGDDEARTTSSTGRTVVRTAAAGRSRSSTARSAAAVPSS
jgi:hypothetical protein